MSSASAASKKRDPRILVVGAGMSGILSAIRLQKAGFSRVTILEKADRVGGTWRENTYPGIACDVPAHYYTYSFEGNPGYSSRFADGTEICRYFDEVAHKYHVHELIRFSSEVRRASYSDGGWTVETTAGEILEADILLCATGFLHHPNIPQFKGMEQFAGHVWHSARWNHDVDITDKRVAIIGTGSSATQIVAEIADKVAGLTLFQRTAQWVAPLFNRNYTEKQKARLLARPERQKRLRNRYEWAFRMLFPKLVTGNRPIQWIISRLCLWNLETKVKDPVLREKLRPDYQAGCKRLILASGFYEALQLDTSEVVTESVEQIEPEGIRTVDGVLHPVDVIVLATGFKAHAFMRPMEVRGLHGVTLAQSWQKGAYAHKTLTLPGFPNLFMLTGPNSPIGNYSLISINELQLDYIVQMIELWSTGQVDEMQPRKDVTAAFNEELQKSMAGTIWVTGCQSWYFDEFGQLAMWPFSMGRFEREMAAPDLKEFELRKLG